MDERQRQLARLFLKTGDESAGARFATAFLKSQPSPTNQEICDDSISTLRVVCMDDIRQYAANAINALNEEGTAPGVDAHDFISEYLMDEETANPWCKYPLSNIMPVLFPSEAEQALSDTAIYLNFSRDRLHYPIYNHPVLDLHSDDLTDISESLARWIVVYLALDIASNQAREAGWDI